MAAQNNYQLLIQKLDQFIRKYYVNKLIRGVLYSVGFILLLFLLVDLLIYYSDFGTATRTGLFFSFLGLSLGALLYWVFIPLSKYFRLGKLISHEQAANIIGDHFGDVKDKLLNILQLKQQADASNDNGLILAGIDQKSEEIKLVPFKSAINLSHNKKYLRYALPPLLLLLVLLFAAPSLIMDGTERLINYGVEFIKPAPFHFVVEQEDDLSVVQYGDFPLTVNIEGEELPNEVFIDLDNVQYRLKKEANNRFSYKFSNVQKELDFQLFAADITSKKYELKVLKKPNLVGFEVKLDFPAYTGRKDETLKSVGDLVVPVGTNIDWVFNAEFTDDIQIAFLRETEKLEVKRFSDELFTFKKRAMQDDVYKLYVSNKALPNADSISYGLTTIPDLYPEIKVEKFEDSTDTRVLYFVGEASDDYGMNSLTFNYRLSQRGSAREAELNTLLLQAPDAKQTSYDHIFDMNELELKPGDEVNYYFEVFDNDAVNGSKSARTNVMVFAMPTVEEYEAMAEANDEQIKENLEKALEEAKKVQDEMKRLKEKLLQEKELDWQNRKELEKLLERQKELEKQIKEAQEAFEENMQNQQEFENPNEETQDKQEQLQQMFEEVMSDEMKEMMQKLEELLQEMDKEEAMQMLDQMELNDENMEMNLERLQELYKQLELEQEMNKALEKIQELADEQEKLAEETEKLADEEEQKDGEQKDGEQKDGEQKDNEQKDGEQKDGEQKDNEQKDGEQKDGEQKDNEQKDGEQKDGEQKDNEQKDEQSKQEELIDKQEDIMKEFDKIQEKMDQIQEKNDQMENKQKMDSQQEQMQDINRDMKDSKMQMQQQQNKKAAQSQKNAAQKMQQMAQQMQSQMQSGQMQQMQEDLESLRQLLENLVGLSFDQEDLIDEFEKVEINTPKYVELVQDQFKLQDDFKLVEDSLRALSKRVFQIESFITEKVTEIKSNMKTGIDDLEERRKYQAADHQQRTMKNVNDLALMLSETMNQMQQQMAAMMQGSQMCGKPQQMQGQGQPSDQISQGQQQLNQKMQQMGQGQEDGNPGLSSEEFAKMAARQAALRRALEEKQKQLRQQGKGNKELQNIINEMDKVEIDLVNKKLRNETLKRQQDILTRLLKHEKAERQREFDQKRKSETGEIKEATMPPSLEEYIKKRKAELELYKTVSPSLKPYYKNLVEEYFKNLKGNN